MHVGKQARWKAGMGRAQGKAHTNTKIKRVPDETWHLRSSLANSYLVKTPSDVKSLKSVSKTQFDGRSSATSILAEKTCGWCSEYG